MHDEIFMLPFPADPPLRTYNYLAYQTGILSSGVHKDAFKGWLYSHYTQLVWNYDSPENIRFDKSCFSPEDLPLKHGLFHIYKEQIRAIANDWLHGILQKSIRQGYYVTGPINEFYVPNRGSFKRNYFFHDYLMYGYDSQKGVYYIAGYNEKRMFSLTEIPFDLYVDGITSALIDDHVFIYTFKSDENSELSYSFKKLYDDLTDYYYGIGENDKYFYGLNVYEKLIIYVEQTYRKKRKNLERNFFYLLYEHKKLMGEKMAYAASLGYLPKEQTFSGRYAEMAGDFQKLCSLCIKQQLTKSVKKESLEKAIEETATNEKTLINEILNAAKLSL